MATDGAFIDAYGESTAARGGALANKSKQGNASLPKVPERAKSTEETGQPVRPPKMVVGRKALANLSANSAASIAHVPFAQAAIAQASDQPIRELDLRKDAESSRALDEQEIVELSAIPRAPAVRRYRTDRLNAGELSLGTTSSLPATDLGYEGTAVIGVTASQCSTQEEPATLRAELEVDRVCWPVSCERLISARRHELRAVVEQIEQQATDGGQVIAVASAQPREGCTTVLLCVARLFAERGRRICLVDGNFARPGLASQLGLCPEIGWEATVPGNRSLAEALIESQADRITVLPIVSSASAKCLEHLKTNGALAALRSTFDLVLMDAGAMVSASSTTADNACVVKLADACLLVKQEASGSRWTEQACRQLEDWKIPLIGLVENRCRA